MTLSLTSILLGVLLGTNSSAVDELPRHPDDLTFSPLVFEPPTAAEFRHTLSNGVPVYMAPSREFPLISVTFGFRGGEHLVPVEKSGLAGMTGSMIRRGGTQTMSAEDLDEELDFLAANCSSWSSGASLNCLRSNFEQAFALFLDLVKSPAFQADKVKVYRDQVLEGMKQRNDDAGSILAREWDFLLYGLEHPLGRVTTAATLASITEDDLRAYHAQVFQPGNLIVSASGDFAVEEMQAWLETAMSGWTKGERQPPMPEPTRSFDPGVYHVDKDIPQGKVTLGMRSVRREHPDHIPLELMNHILGGGGFVSRITSRVRSDEGLAYSAGSRFSMPVWYAGEFNAFFQSKNRTVARAIQVILEEIERIRAEPVSEEELSSAQQSYIETFPRTFESKSRMMSLFVSDEWTERPADWWQKYRERVQAVTIEDIQRVAKEHLDTTKMAIFVVGKWAEIAEGDLEGRAKMSEFFGGEHTELPLRDPLTMERMD